MRDLSSSLYRKTPTAGKQTAQNVAYGMDRRVSVLPSPSNAARVRRSKWPLAESAQSAA